MDDPIPYPSWVYHPDQPATIVAHAEAFSRLPQQGWSFSPFVSRPVENATPNVTDRTVQQQQQLAVIQQPRQVAALQSPRQKSMLIPSPLQVPVSDPLKGHQGH